MFSNVLAISIYSLVRVITWTQFRICEKIARSVKFIGYERFLVYGINKIQRFSICGQDFMIQSMVAFRRFSSFPNGKKKRPTIFPTCLLTMIVLIWILQTRSCTLYHFNRVWIVRFVLSLCELHYSLVHYRLILEVFQNYPLYRTTLDFDISLPQLQNLYRLLIDEYY